MSMNRLPNPSRSGYDTWAPIATPRSAAAWHTRRNVDGSPAWKPQATLALVTMSSMASSSPRLHTPNDSPRSALRSTAAIDELAEQCRHGCVVEAAEAATTVAANERGDLELGDRQLPVGPRKGRRTELDGRGQ